MTNTNEIKVGSQTNKGSIVWGFWVFAARPIKISIQISAARLIYFSKVEKGKPPRRVPLRALGKEKNNCEAFCCVGSCRGILL